MPQPSRMINRAFFGVSSDCGSLLHDVNTLVTQTRMAASTVKSFFIVILLPLKKISKISRKIFQVAVFEIVFCIDEIAVICYT